MVSGILDVVFRWLHVIAGIMWIGHLWFFNFVNGPFAAKMKEAGASKTVVPELMPRALFWFRWGAAWTWITGVLLAALVFYMGGILFDPPHTWNLAAFVCLALVFGSPFIYDALYKSPLAANARNAAIVSYVLVAVMILLMKYWGGFSYRGYNIHTGAMFGTIMAYNVWFRIWPSQQKIIRAVKAGEAPDPALVALAGMRSRHNTYMSVPLVWTMLNLHSALTEFATWQWVGLLVMIAIGWHIVFQLYRKSALVQGF
jgi:uncharacterized membrane protein